MGSSAKRRTIGVMASSAASLPAQERGRLDGMARRLGAAIAKESLVVITGETNGIPAVVADAARAGGALTIGVCGAHSRTEQLARYPVPDNPSDVVIYTGFGLKGRNVVSVRSSEIVLIVAGSIGTLNEFTIAYDEGKVIGVLTGTGGVADRIHDILAASPKPSAAVMIYSDDPDQLVSDCVRAAEERAG